MRQLTKKIVLLITLGLAACSSNTPLEVTPPTAPPAEAPPTASNPKSPEGPDVRIIYDTDFGLDVDDVGALGIMHTLANQNEVVLLGVVSNVSDRYAPAAIDVINTYYGRPDIPIGLTTLPYYAEAYPYWRDPSPRYIKTLAARFPHDTPTDPAEIPGAVETYRKLLAAQPDKSVTIASVGFLQNLAGLLDSPPDAYSPLDGAALVTRKVKELVIMGGHYPSSSKDLYLTGGREMDSSYAIKVIDTWPTKIVFNTGPVCQAIKNGQTLAAATPETNPVRAAYTLFFGEEGNGRTSWDLCSVLYAVRGTEGPEGRYFEIRTDERLTLDQSGYNVWVAPGNNRHQRLTRVMADKTLQDLLEKLLVTPPAN